ncbi:MAG: 50S ribosomal protein L21 [Candidatus Sericytochromatia bacterium]|nr:50S ribosomal protein L21 [Candidatus Sericytochromatia bacterium]
MYAIIATGGKQYKVEAGRFVDVELLPQDKDEQVVFSQVLLIADGEKVSIGTPMVAGATVKGKVLLSGKKWCKRFRATLSDEELAQKGRPGLAPKVIIYKQRPKKHYRRKRGHRQPFTRVLIESIGS